MFLFSHSFRNLRDIYNHSHIHLFHIHEDAVIDKQLQIIIKHREIEAELEKLGLHDNTQEQYFLIYHIY